MERKYLVAETTLKKHALVDTLVKQAGLNREDANKAVDHIVSELTFERAGRLLADQACNSCLPPDAEQ
jgi:polyhydroxyalkanoate synthesis regulator phasin